MLNQIYLIVRTLVIYFVLISGFAVFLTIYDKYKAKHHSWRVPESSLIWVSCLGGSLAMYITMKIIHHKTQHKKFMIGIPVIMVIQAILIILLTWGLFKANERFYIPPVEENEETIVMPEIPLIPETEE